MQRKHSPASVLTALQQHYYALLNPNRSTYCRKTKTGSAKNMLTAAGKSTGGSINHSFSVCMQQDPHP